MMKIQNMQWVYAGIGIVLAFAVSVLFVSGVFAEGRTFFKRGADSAATKSAVHAAFENADYNAYVTAITNAHNRSILTEEEFNAHAQKIARKQQINDTFVADDYAAYSALTEGSIRQLSESTFHKKAEMLRIKEEIREAIQDRDFAAFKAKKEALKLLLGDEYVSHRRGKEEMTEEQFNALASRVEEMGGDVFGRKKGRYGHDKGFGGMRGMRGKNNCRE